MFGGGSCPGTRFQGTICNARRHRKSGISCAGRQGRVGNGERVKWVCKWHADADWAKPNSLRVVEWIGRKRSGRQARIKE